MPNPLLKKRPYITVFIIGILMSLALYIKSVIPLQSSTPITPPPPWKTYSNNDAGYGFSYPLDFKFESKSTFDLGLSGSIDEVYLSKVDINQKQYTVISDFFPGDQNVSGTIERKYYPDYYISFYVTKGDPYLNRAISFKIPPKESLRKIGDIFVGGENGSMYMYISKDGTSERVTIVEANGYTYTIDYNARTGSLHTEEKYIPLYKKIISSIKFLPKHPNGLSPGIDM